MKFQDALAFCFYALYTHYKAQVLLGVFFVAQNKPKGAY